MSDNRPEPDYAAAESFFAEDRWDGAEPYVVAAVFAVEHCSAAESLRAEIGLERIKTHELSKQIEKLTQWKRTVENAFTAGILGMEHGSLMGGTKLTAHGFITSLRVAMRQAEDELGGRRHESTKIP